MTEAATAAALLLGLPLRDGPMNADSIRRAFRRRALVAHPDRPTGSSAEFRRLVAAKEYLLASLHKPASRSTGNTHINNTQYRHGNAPPPFSKPPASSVAAVLADGSVYVFDKGPFVYGTCTLQHGDIVVRLGPRDPQPSGRLGRIIGASSTGTLYWWAEGSPIATVFSLSRKEQVKYRRVDPSAAHHCRNTRRASSPVVVVAARHEEVYSSSSNCTSVVGSPIYPCGTGAAPPATTLQLCVEEEASVRGSLLLAMEAYLSQAQWVAGLPRYASVDYQYNTLY